MKWVLFFHFKDKNLGAQSNDCEANEESFKDPLAWAPFKILAVYLLNCVPFFNFTKLRYFSCNWLRELSLSTLMFSVAFSFMSSGIRAAIVILGSSYREADLGINLVWV